MYAGIDITSRDIHIAIPDGWSKIRLLRFKYYEHLNFTKFDEVARRLIDVKNYIKNNLHVDLKYLVLSVPLNLKIVERKIIKKA